MKERKLPQELTVIDECISTTGKYACCLGQHFDPILCYDVVALNRVTGEAKRLHFREKDAAYTKWTEFKKDITAKRTESEEDEHDRYHHFSPKGKVVN